VVSVAISKGAKGPGSDFAAAGRIVPISSEKESQGSSKPMPK